MSKGFFAILVLVVGLLVAIFFIGNHDTKPAEAPKLFGIQHKDQGQKHLKPGETHEPYNSNLPSSGPHNPAPTSWGVKDTPIVDETLVHNLEHGGIVIAYKPDLAPADVNKLKALAGKLPRSSSFSNIKVVVVPRAANTKPIQLAAWRYTHDLDKFDESAITKFYNDHLDKGPELVP